MRSSGLARIALVTLALAGAALAVRLAAPSTAPPPPVSPPDDGVTAPPPPVSPPGGEVTAGQRQDGRQLSGRVPLAGGEVMAGQRQGSRQGFDPREMLRRRRRGTLQRPAGPHEFYFTRAIYSSGWGWSRWATDYPKADRQFMTVVNRLIDIDGSPYENAVRLDDPRIRDFPFLYALEVGDIALSQAEIEGLRNYLLAGGFLVIDDFWGSWEWAAFEQQIRKVFPEHPIVDVPLDHPVFNAVYRIDEVLQVPAIGNYWGGRTWERDGYEAHVRGIFDDKGRLMVLINWNTDLGDAWEWAERPEYPLKFSTFAVEMGINFIVYAMSH